MKYNPKIHHRGSIRLKGYDYSQTGLYYITICCQNRHNRFGHVQNRDMILNDAGKMVSAEWLALTYRFKNIVLHEFILMPNHFHAIIEISNTFVEAPIVGAPFNAESEINAELENNAAFENNVRSPLVVAPFNAELKKNDAFENNTDLELNETEIVDEIGATTRVAPTSKTVGDMVGAFKSITTVEYIRGVKSLGWKPFDGKLWQRNYYERIIRNERAFINISKYIINNPAKWNGDKFYE